MMAETVVTVPPPMTAAAESWPLGNDLTHIFDQALEPSPDDAEWEEALLHMCEGIVPGMTPVESAALLRQMMANKLLRFTDMQTNPERFFLCHRLGAAHLLNGFSVRFTVQFNLFAGSVLGLGGEAQVAELEGLQRECDDHVHDMIGCVACSRGS